MNLRVVKGAQAWSASPFTVDPLTVVSEVQWHHVEGQWFFWTPMCPRSSWSASAIEPLMAHCNRAFGAAAAKPPCDARPLSARWSGSPGAKHRTRSQMMAVREVPLKVQLDYFGEHPSSRDIPLWGHLQTFY